MKTDKYNSYIHKHLKNKVFKYKCNLKIAKNEIFILCFHHKICNFVHNNNTRIFSFLSKVTFYLTGAN